jgi:sugar lactone lactonase YvrE
MVQQNDGRTIFAECPVWSARDRTLYWLDIVGPALGRLQLDTPGYQRFGLRRPVAAIALRARGGLIAVEADGFSALDPQTGHLSRYAQASWTAAEVPNDGKCDPQGRFWVGTKDSLGGLESGALYVLDTDGKCRRVAGGFGNVNGPGWSPDGTLLYVTDTRRSEIYVYDFSGNDGGISERRTLVRVAPEHGRPDGLTVDADGFIWSANWQGGSIFRYAPDGSVASIVRITAPCPTSCTFGGARLDVLYVTIAKFDDNNPPGATNDALLALPGLAIGRPESSFLG